MLSPFCSPSFKEHGVLFFADDDNAYSLELFDLIRTTRKVFHHTLLSSYSLNFQCNLPCFNVFEYQSSPPPPFK